MVQTASFVGWKEDFNLCFQENIQVKFLHSSYELTSHKDNLKLTSQMDTQDN